MSESLPVPVTHPTKVLSITHSIAATKDVFSPKLDDLERYLLPKVKDSDSLGNFLLDYTELKSNKAGAELIKSVFWYAVLDKGATSITPETVSVELQARDTFSQCLKSIKIQIREKIDDYPDALHACILSSNAPDVIRKRAYSFFVGKLVITPGRLENKYQSPRLAAVYVLDQVWNLSPDVMRVCIRNLPEAEPEWSLRLPSKAHDQKIPNPASTFAPAIVRSTFKLTWQYAVSKYRNDLNVYVWRPFAKEPKLECAEIFLQPAQIDLNTLLIIFTSSENSTRLVDGYRNKRASKLPYSVSRAHNVKGDVAISLYVVYMQLVEDTGVFLTSLHNAVAKLKYSGRIAPSGSKVEYLLHLEDCRQQASMSLENAVSILHDISELGKDDSVNDPAMTQWSSSIGDDINYLQQELKGAELQIASLHTMIKSQIDLRQVRRTTLLTLLASIYIPFSFISSLYGMNLANPLWSSENSPAQAPVAQSSPTNSALSQPETDAIVSAIQSSGPFLFTFQSYWYISVGATVVTIVLPLIAGATLRWTMRLLAKAKLYWRVAVFWALGTYNVNSFSHNIYQNYTSGLVVLFSLYKLGVALHQRRRRRIWLFWTLVYAGAWVLELTVIPISSLVGCLVQLHFGWASFWRVRHLSRRPFSAVRQWLRRQRQRFHLKQGS